MNQLNTTNRAFNPPIVKVENENRKLLDAKAFELIKTWRASRLTYTVITKRLGDYGYVGKRSALDSATVSHFACNNGLREHAFAHRNGKAKTKSKQEQKVIVQAVTAPITSKQALAESVVSNSELTKEQKLAALAAIL